MAEEKKSESDDSGSSGVSPELNVDPNSLGGGAGQSTNQTSQAKDEGKKEEVVPKSQYTELEKKIGEQGEELGKSRKFIEELTPLLEKLEGREDLVKAIMDDKIDPKFIESVMKGEVSKEEAETATEAHQEVKKELGKKEYEKASPEKIEELVSKKIAEGLKESEKKLNERLTEAELMRNFQKEVDDFIARTPDFPEYAVEVNKYVEDKGLDDIEVAYHAVKGMRIAKEAEKKKQEEEGENAKNIAANLAGGGVQSTQVVSDPDIVDKLVGRRTNPNVFN